MFATVMRVALTPAERADLEHLLRATSTPSGIARRARAGRITAWRRPSKRGSCS